MTIRTKIICTLGPSVNSLEKVIQLIQAGMNVARLNFSHGSYDDHLESINRLKQAREQLGVPLAIMLDTKGPEIRLGKIKDGQIALPAGHRWLLTKEQLEGDAQCVSVYPANVLDQLRIGSEILFDDGYVNSTVTRIDSRGVEIEIKNGGVLKSGKSVNIPGELINLPAVTEKDIEDIRFGCAHDIDIIAASFVRSPDHVIAIKKLLQEEHKSQILVIAKIENREGVQNFDGILQVADGIMIARGDLGVQLPLSEVPRLQKMMIRKCYLAGKPSVTATQMLESMIHNPRPTRAEVSDVANAIYDSTSAVMLSGETAVGKYPLEAVQMMKKIIMEAEGDFEYRLFFDHHSSLVYQDVPSALTLAAVKTAYSLNASAIFAFTEGGSTARLLSRLRPFMPIIAMTPNIKSYHQMAFNWGVIPVFKPECKDMHEAFTSLSQYALESRWVEYGDLVIVTAGSPFGISGTTNIMVVESIGEVLVRGHQGFGKQTHGNVSMVLSADDVKPYSIRGSILLILRCDASYEVLIKEAKGIILENDTDDLASEEYLVKTAKELNKPCILRADAAMRILKEGQLVTISPDKGLIYKGVVL